MAVFKAPRITTIQRLSIVLQESELVYDIDEQKPYYGDGVTAGGVEFTKGAKQTNFYQSPVFSLTQQQLSDKNILLPHTPSEGSVNFNLQGLFQFESVDFYLDQNLIRWDNYGLDGFLDENDLIQISYAYL